MRKLILILSAFLILSSTTAAMAASTPKEISENILEVISTQGIRASTNVLVNSNPNLKGLELDKGIAQFASIESLLGDKLGYDIAYEQDYGENMRLVVGVLYYDLAPMITRFKYYKPKKSWILVDFNWNSPDRYFAQFPINIETAKGTTTAAHVQATSDKTMSLIIDGRIKEAFEGLAAMGSPQLFTPKDVVALRQQLEHGIKLEAGKPLAFEAVLGMHFADNLYLSHYVFTCENLPFYFQLMHHKVGDDWKLNGIRFGPTLEEFFQ